MTSLTVLLLLFSCFSTCRAQIFYQCDFEEPCEDFQFDSHWFVANVSSHADHTFGNLSGHYITYMNTSTSYPLTTFRTRDWVDPPENFTSCISMCIYSGPGGVYYEIVLAQGDDLQARFSAGFIGTNVPDPQWRCVTLEMPYVTHFIPSVVFTNITSHLDLDDISMISCLSSRPIPPQITAMSCDFDKHLCPDLVSLSGYTYNWYIDEAQAANNYTSEAPSIDYSTQSGEGHYLWLNNSRMQQTGAVGYLKTPVFRFTRDDPMYCLSFHYYGYGSGVQKGKLSVFAFAEDAEKSVEKVWPIDPTNYVYAENQWTWAFTPLRIGNYSLLFRIESNDPGSGSFAVDSIVVASCEYPQRYYSGTSQLDFACDFDSEDSMCGVMNDGTNLPPQSTYDLSVRSPRSITDRDLGPHESSGFSGPNFFYWFHAENSPTTVTSGQFKTPLIETNQKMCVRFSYFINSTDAEGAEPKMTIDVVTYGCSNETIRSIKGYRTHRWEMIVKGLPSVVCTQSIYFRITQQKPVKAVVAFDDITIALCDALPPLTTTTSTSTTSTKPTGRSSSTGVSSIVMILIVMIFLHMHL